MAKLRETFNMKLLLSTAQKRAWKIMENQAMAIHREVSYIMYDEHKLDFIIAENLLLEHKSFKKQAPDLLEFSRSQIASDSYKYLRENGKLTRRSKKPVVFVPEHTIIFSTNERVVSLPYVGLTKYNPNKHFDPLSMEENQIWLRQNIRKIGLGVKNNEYVCVVDCMDEQEELRRIKSKSEKIKRKNNKIRTNLLD